jgi:glycosyltransferase involved in cell wall biosynthesis
MEAMAAGLPVAAYRGGGVDEMVVDRETGLLVEPGDVAGLASALAGLAADPAASREMGDRGRSRAEAEFSLDRHVDGMERLFQGLVEDA